MATGRTHKKYTKVYANGYDLTGYATELGPLSVVYDSEGLTALNDATKSGLPGQAEISFGTYSGIFDNTATSGFHVLHEAADQTVVISAVIGIKGIPAAGDPVFSGEFRQMDYMVNGDATMVAATMSFPQTDALAVTQSYPRAWGQLNHANGAETAVNGGTSDHDVGASTAFGGYGFLHLLAGNGSCTFSIESSDTNVDGNFDSDGDIITFATTDASTPFSEIKTTAALTTTILRYSRWQISLGTATTVTFVMGLVRGHVHG